DIYSLGTVLYEVIAGARPFGEAQGRALRQAVLAEEPIPLRAVAPRAPRELAALVESMLAREVGRRPRSVAEVRQRLLALGVPPVVPATGAPPLLGRGR